MSASEPKPVVPDTDTARLEAFSDGVFAIAITLLVLNLAVPLSGELKGPLWDALLRQWPVYVAYLISFLFILIMWTNHHRLFRYIRRSDHMLLLLNGLLLLFITLVPFPTRLLAEYLESPNRADQRVAALVYNGTYVLIAIAFNLLWWYAVRNRRLLDETVHPSHLQAVTNDYRYGGIPVYLVTFVLTFVNVWLSLAANVGLAIFWALPRSRKRRSSRA